MIAVTATQDARCPDCGYLLRSVGHTVSCVLTRNVPRRPAVSFTHGTYSAYERHGCRCDKCRAHHNERVRRTRGVQLADGSLTHGMRSAYDAGCRCDRCKGARREAYQRLESAS